MHPLKRTLAPASPVTDVDGGRVAMLRRGIAAASTAPLEELGNRIDAGTATIGVVGLGYVGLPLLVAATDAGFPVVGLDSDQDKVHRLLAAESYIDDIDDARLRSLRNCTFSDRPVVLSRADVIVITVPTPLRSGTPDLAYVERAAHDVAGVLRPGQLVVLESTTYPGTTEHVIAPILERSMLHVGAEVALAFSPERIDPGSGHSFESTPKVVAGVDATSTDLAVRFYSRITSNVVTCRRPREAELSKLIENTFRQVNIGLVNELAVACAELDVDIWDALDAAATKPYGYMPFWPGPGVGGHCIAIDPSYLSWWVERELGFGMTFVQHALSVNKRMPGYVAARIGQALDAQGKATRGARILVLGVSYKPGIADTRESPAIQVVERLLHAGAKCSYHDPLVPEVAIAGRRLVSQPLTPDVVSAHDCVAILAPHADDDVDRLVRPNARLVFDARGVTRNVRCDNTVLL